jgi:hypothetical protein
MIQSSEMIYGVIVWDSEVVNLRMLVGEGGENTEECALDEDILYTDRCLAIIGQTVLLL